MSKSTPLKLYQSVGDQEDLWREILRAPQVMVCKTNSEMQFIDSTQAGLDFYGLTIEEFRVAPWREYLHPEDLPQVMNNFHLALKEHPVIRQEYRAKKHDGKYAWILDVHYPRFGPSGEFLGYFGSIVDITEQKFREQGLKAEIAKISEWEQNRIGSDLHDGLAQVVLGISLKAMAMENKLKRRDMPEFFIAREIAEESRRVLSSLRKISQALFPATLSGREFCSAIRNLAERYSRENGFPVTLSVDPGAVPEDSERALLLFRIAQEGITNAVRHGRANHIHILLKTEGDGRHLLEIRDDGIGLTGNPRAAGGLGMRLIDHRATLLGAEIELGRSRTGGTVLRCHYR